YLFPDSSGLLHLEYLPHDRERGKPRGLFQYRDHTRLFSHWNLSTSLEFLSDDDYLRDFGTDLAQVSQTYQYRRVTASYQAAAGSAFITLQDLAPLDPSITAAERPYRKLPEIGFDFSWPNYTTGLEFSLFNDFTRFEAPERQGALREDLRPAIAEHFGNASWYATPRLAYDLTRYDLHDFGNAPAGTVNRDTPIFSFDSGLVFDRTLGKGGWLTQTLEPRAFYLYVPYRDQSEIPIFDTYQPPLTMEQLFSTNRFVGLDRLGDANQLSLGLSSLFIDSASGEQLLSLGIGQAFYFRDRDVTLPGEAPETSARSDYVGEVAATLSPKFSASLTVDYNPYDHEFDQGYLSFQYHPRTYQVLNVGYLYRQGQLDQTDLSFAWPIAGNWSGFGRWNYSILDHQTVETMAGLQYDSCCWRLRIAERRYATINGQGSYALYLELQLKGLGSIGNRVSDLLQHDIYGYGENPDY
ncbi:MAG TPA: LPS-assembly protein LptD, partial [Gammaproteobacteria bacterium]|nr:LPS-assembly protein LptD [Gammaproteobacteria bacterium]